MEIAVFHIIKMNLIAGIFVLLVILVSKYLGRRYSARWKYWCWLILAVFLLIPVDFSPYLSVVQVGIPAASSQAMDLRASEETAVVESQSFQASDGNSKTSIGELPGSTEKTVSQKDLQEFEPYHFQNGKYMQGSDVTVSTEGYLISFEVLLFVWISGVCIISLYQIVKYQTANRQLMRWSYPAKGEKVLEVLERQSRRMEIRKKPRVMMNGQISSPMLAGFFRPCLFMPELPYTYGQLELICRHELVHYRQRDIWYKSLLIFVRTIYWFNPALYLMFREAGKDLELVCDEKVMKNAGKETRLTYNQLLISAVEKKGRTRILFSTGFNGGIGAIKKRMANIMYMERRRRGICFGALCCVFLVGSTVLIGCFVVESQTQVTAAAVDSVLLKEVNQGTEVLVDSNHEKIDQMIGVLDAAAFSTLSTSVELAGTLSEVEDENGLIWEGEQVATSPEGTGYIEAVYPDSSFYGLHIGMSKEQAEDNLSRNGWRWNNIDSRNTEFISGEMDSLVLSWGEDGTVQGISWKAGN